MHLDSFLNELKNFIEISDTFSDGWKHENNGDFSYIYKTETRVVPLGDVKPHSDCAKLTRWEYHVLYSASYQVPLLYFNAWHLNGQLLSLDEVLEAVHLCHKSSVLQNKWSALTQQEHPYLRRPFYFLHPCKSNDLPDFNTGSFLLTWLSSVGPVVGLHLPQFYALEHKT